MPWYQIRVEAKLFHKLYESPLIEANTLFEALDKAYVTNVFDWVRNFKSHSNADCFKIEQVSLK